MFDRSGSRKTGILRSEKYLSPIYTPETAAGRDEEIQEIADALRPLVRRRPPEHILLHGPSGTGKTTCVQHVFNRLEKETSTKTVTVNCWKYNTRPSLLTAILIQLGYPIPRKGRPIDNILSKLREWLDKHKGSAVLLDEFDQLRDRTQVIYDLQHVNQEAEHSLGIIMVSNQDPSQIELGPRSRSRLNYTEVQFKPYNQKQLLRILQKRVEQAFKPGTVPEEVVETVAQKTAETSGDCRQALEILLKAGRKADKENNRGLTLEHIQSEL